MADPGAVIGLISGIITFVDFGFKVVGSMKQLKDAGKGTPQELAELNSVAADIRHFNKVVKSQIPKGRNPSKAEARILNMVNECEVLCGELGVLMKDLSARNSSMLEFGRVAVKSAWRKSDIDGLRNRMVALGAQITANVQLTLQENQHTSVMSQLTEMERQLHDLGVRKGSQVDVLRDDILRLAKDCEGRVEKQLEAQADIFAVIVAKLDALQNGCTASQQQVRVLESLYFPEIRRRFDMIPSAEQRTNLWIYDTTKTTFTTWLESTDDDDGLFYIFGKAGSGKSTLMKFIYESSQTEESLKKWAGSRRYHIGCYYFWNQGSEMQKSATGLFQCLLYQILCTCPEYAPDIALGRRHYELWDQESLKNAFRLVTQEKGPDSKYLFFIDGLDEYDGEEEDIIDMLKAISFSGHIKVCASSRPFRRYQKYVLHDRVLAKKRLFDIANFTSHDMASYVHERLHSSDEFLELAYPNNTDQEIAPICKQIITDISSSAQGVWLWVFLVTRQLIRQIKQKESTHVLRRIVIDFPPDLESFFAHIITKIDDLHKEEMAQTFLITVDELRPLPLYAFSLLEREREDPQYAMRMLIEPPAEENGLPDFDIWRSRVYNRCGDLLIVDPENRSGFYSHSVDFLHRTVRDFLRDCFKDQLRTHLKKDFDPLVSLCNITLCFLKGLPIADFRSLSTFNAVIGLTDDLLYYAHEIERRNPQDRETPLIGVLDEMDRVNAYHARGITNHWTHARDSPKKQGFDKYAEGGQCNFLALTVQARLVKYVRTKLEMSPECIRKDGRPLLDYALRPLRSTPIEMPYHSMRDDPSVDVDMVKLLIEHGAEPNERVFLNDGETVWGLFLISMHSTRGCPFESLKEAWFRTCLVMIKAGAAPNYAFVNRHFKDHTVSSLISMVFSNEKAAALEKALEISRAELKSRGVWSVIPSFVSNWF